MQRQQALELTGDEFLDARDVRARQKPLLDSSQTRSAAKISATRKPIATRCTL
jgi:hypothetical protein